MTDEDFRETFLREPIPVLMQLLERALHLAHADIAALVAMDVAFWKRVAEQVDTRLQKSSLKS